MREEWDKGGGGWGSEGLSRGWESSATCEEPCER